MAQPSFTSSARAAFVSAACLLPACGADDGAPELNNGAGSSQGSNDDVTPPGETGFELVCTPGEIRCDGQEFLETCAPTGIEWLSEPCPSNAFCQPCDAAGDTCTVDHCVGPCELAENLPSSAGCSFLANRQLHPAEEWEDGVIIGNPNTEVAAMVNVFKIPEGKRKEELVEGFPVSIAPGEAFAFRINTSFIQGYDSMFRTGGMFRIDSDVPVIAYQHSPFENNAFNESSLLLPENVLGQDYVILSYPPVPSAVVPAGGRPSYFEIIALQDGTTVEWTPPYATHGNGLPIKPIAPGETGVVSMNRFDTMRIAASDNDTESTLMERDVSGTVVHADKPIWVVGATRCSAAPVPPLFRGATCDPVQELLFPLQHWGTTYVAAAPPPRAEEWVHWRIYAGDADVTVTSEPSLDVFPYTFSARGEFIDVSVPPHTHFLLEGNGPFMPVMHLQSHRGEIWTDETKTVSEEFPGGLVGGDTSMAQMVPVEQFLDRYVFITGVGYLLNWVVVIREVGNADVLVDGDVVDDFVEIGGFEVAHVALVNVREDDTDAHLAESEDPFGIIQVGYSTNIPQGEPGADGCINPGDGGFCNSSYAYPGGMKTEVINIP